MFEDYILSTVFSSTKPRAAASSAPLGWRYAVPLIGSASIGLWALIGKAFALLVA